MINVFEPALSQNEAAAAAEVMTGGWIGRGPKVAAFEAAWAAHIGVNPENVVSISTCTEGLFQAVELLGIGPGDEVIIPSIHFIGAANAVIKAGARPVFCDVDSRTLNAGSKMIQDAVTRKTKAMIVLSYGGVIHPVDDLIEMPGKPKFIADCACSPATRVKGEAYGMLCDIAVWSFDAMKILSTGDGGMVYCQDPELAQRLRQNIYLGMDETSGLSSSKERWWEFEVTGPGRRAIMNDITAAIGLEQLKKLPRFVARRKEIWGMYNERLAGLDWLTLPPPVPDYVESSYYFYWVQLEKRDELARYLKERDVYVTFRYYPLHRVFKTGQKLPGADRAADRTLLLPLHQGLSSDEVEYICECVRGFEG
jgi:dTDP-4-amino-4,6-dideoxygalactose transaminase